MARGSRGVVSVGVGPFRVGTGFSLWAPIVGLLIGLCCWGYIWVWSQFNEPPQSPRPTVTSTPR